MEKNLLILAIILPKCKKIFLGLYGNAGVTAIQQGRSGEGQKLFLLGLAWGDFFIKKGKISEGVRLELLRLKGYFSSPEIQ